MVGFAHTRSGSKTKLANSNRDLRLKNYSGADAEKDPVGYHGCNQHNRLVADPGEWPFRHRCDGLKNQITARMMTALLTNAAARLNAVRMTNSCLFLELAVQTPMLRTPK